MNAPDHLPPPPPGRTTDMTDRTDHRAAAERMLADADEWAAQARPAELRGAGELTSLAYAAVHALLAIHDTLTAADRDAINEAKQREAEPDPLDEDDHRDRLTSSGHRLRRWAGGCWHIKRPASHGSSACAATLGYWAGLVSPLAFAPDATQEATDGDLSASERESGAEERGEADNTVEPLLCPECGHYIDHHHGRRCVTLCECKALPSVIARALIRRAVEQAGGGHV